MISQVFALAVVDALEALTGITLYAVLLVLAVLLFVGPYQLARRSGLGSAHSIGAGISGLGFVFLFLIVIQIIHSPI